MAIDSPRDDAAFVDLLGQRLVALGWHGTRLDECIEIGSADANPPRAKTNIWQFGAVQPVADGLSVQLEKLCDLGDRQELIIHLVVEPN